MTPPARIHLLSAKECPLAAVLWRTSAKTFHVMTWNTETDSIQHGSWFKGKLYPLECDISFDGGWMVYFARGATGQDWTGVCQLPWLKTIWDVTGPAFDGGGYWRSRDELVLNCRADHSEALEQRWSSVEARSSNVLGERLKRDGWCPAWPMPEVTFGAYLRTVPDVAETVPWLSGRPTPQHPALRILYRRHTVARPTYTFDLEEFPSVLGADTDWATWDARGQLLVARAGAVERWTLEDLERGTPTSKIDFEGLTPSIRD